MNKVAIILLNYNNHIDTLECVDSIRKFCTIPNEIIVVDNCSRKESVDQLKCFDNYYTLILSDVNGGFAAGNNIGIKYALKNNYKYILLLNNDTLITKNSVEILYSIIDSDNNIGIVSPKIMYYPNTEMIWFNGGYIDRNTYVGKHYDIGKSEVLNLMSVENEIKEVDFLSGCCMLIRSEVFEKVDLLSEEYFMYFEDVDFCLKVSQNNYKLIASQKSKIYHKVSASSGGENSPFTIEWGNRNRLILIHKHRNSIPTVHFYKIIFIFYLTRFIKIFQYLIMGNFKNIVALFKGVKNGLDYLENNKNILL